MFLEEDGLAMESPMSSIPPEFYIQYLEHICIVFILNKYKILGYFKCVDNILVIYSDETTDINDMLLEFNTVSPKLKFMLELEKNYKIIFLNVTI